MSLVSRGTTASNASRTIMKDVAHLSADTTALSMEFMYVSLSTVRSSSVSGDALESLSTASRHSKNDALS